MLMLATREAGRSLSSSFFKMQFARPWRGGGRKRSRSLNMFFKMQFARRAQEGVWEGNAHALAFCGAGRIDLLTICKVSFTLRLQGNFSGFFLTLV